MRGFLSSRRFREAWMVSLVAGALFPFISAILNSESELSYLERVNASFLQNAMSFAALFFVIQCVWAVILYRRDLRSDEEKSV